MEEFLVIGNVKLINLSNRHITQLPWLKTNCTMSYFPSTLQILTYIIAYDNDDDNYDKYDNDDNDDDKLHNMSKE